MKDTKWSTQLLELLSVQNIKTTIKNSQLNNIQTDLICVIENKLAHVNCSQLPEELDPFIVELKRRIAEYLKPMLKGNLDKLLQILYRIDVHDTHIKAALKLDRDSASANLLAHAIVERQIKKIQSQQYYKEQGGY